MFFDYFLQVRKGRRGVVFVCGLNEDVVDDTPCKKSSCHGRKTNVLPMYLFSVDVVFAVSVNLFGIGLGIAEKKSVRFFTNK